MVYTSEPGRLRQGGICEFGSSLMNFRLLWLWSSLHTKRKKIILVLVLFSTTTAVVKYCDKSTWGRKHLFWFIVQGFSESWQSSHNGGRHLKQMVTLHPPSKGREWWTSKAHLPHSLCHPGLDLGNVATHIYRVGLPTLVNPLKIHSHTHAQRLVPGMILNPEKLTILANTVCKNTPNSSRGTRILSIKGGGTVHNDIQWWLEEEAHSSCIVQQEWLLSDVLETGYHFMFPLQRRIYPSFCLPWPWGHIKPTEKKYEQTPNGEHSPCLFCSNS